MYSWIDSCVAGTEGKRSQAVFFLLLLASSVKIPQSYSSLFFFTFLFSNGPLLPCCAKVALFFLLFFRSITPTPFIPPKLSLVTVGKLHPCLSFSWYSVFSTIIPYSGMQVLQGGQLTVNHLICLFWKAEGGRGWRDWVRVWVCGLGGWDCDGWFREA